jgi:hypothetical protein
MVRICSDLGNFRSFSHSCKFTSNYPYSQTYEPHLSYRHVSSTSNGPYLARALGLREFFLLHTQHTKIIELAKSEGLQGLKLVPLTWIQWLLILVLISDGYNLFFLLCMLLLLSGTKYNGPDFLYIPSNGFFIFSSSETSLPFSKGFFLIFQRLGL